MGQDYFVYVFNQVLGASVSESFFPRTSPWKIAFAGTFLILGGFVVAVMFLAWKQQQEKRRVWEVQKEKKEESKAKGKTVTQSWWDL